jgi:protein-S-isoprenylcysteine O-methyltransferase Ste14
LRRDRAEIEVRREAVVALGNLLFSHRNKIFPIFYLLLFTPAPLLTERRTTILIVGFLIGAVGQTVRVATVGLKYIIRGGRRRRVYAEDLVTDGIFAHCRNPLYVGNILILLGLGVMANSLLFLVVAAPLFVFMYAAIVRAEEDYLGRRFGDAFRRYTEDVNRWIPSLRGLGETFASMKFAWARVLIREYTTTYIWLTGSVLLAMKSLATAPDNSFYREHWPVGAWILTGLLTVYLLVRTLKLRKVITA